MISSLKSAKRMFSFSGLPALLLCAGILLMPLVSGCSGKKNPKSGKTVSKKKQSKGNPKKAPAKKGGGKTGKTAAKKAAAKPSIPAVFTKLTSYEGISLERPFEAGETETLVKIDPTKGIRVCNTERLPGGNMILDASTLQIIRLETKKEYGSEKEAAAAYEKRKTDLEKTLGLPPMQGARGVSFTEMISDGRGRSLQVILSGCTVREIVTAQSMPSTVVPAGKPIHGVFGLILGMPIPPKQVNPNAMLLFYPEPPRGEFAVYKYFNDDKGNVQTILAESEPTRAISLQDALAVAVWLEETFAMKMSYESENSESGVFLYSSEGRVLELRWEEGKLTLSARISRPDKKK